MSFSGFTSEAMKFLLENRFNNSKEWYDNHKVLYKQYVYNPFVQIITELAPTMLEIDSQILTVPSKIISRVRRDTRFTKDKTLYRDNAWFVFLRDKSQMSSSPSFWFEIGQNGSSYGLGYYGAKAASMANMREMIIQDNPKFLNALKCYESLGTFVIGGEMYKRSKFPEQPENLKTWLDRKNIYFECIQKDYKLAFSEDLLAVLKKGFTKLKPIYEFLLSVESYN